MAAVTSSSIRGVEGKNETEEEGELNGVQEGIEESESSSCHVRWRLTPFVLTSLISSG